MTNPSTASKRELQMTKRLTAETVLSPAVADATGHISYLLTIGGGFVFRVSMVTYRVYSAETGELKAGGTTRHELKAAAQELGLLADSRELQLLLDALPVLPAPASALCEGVVRGAGDLGEIPAWVHPVLVAAGAAVRAGRVEGHKQEEAAQRGRPINVVAICQMAGTVHNDAAYQAFASTPVGNPSLLLGRPIPGLAIRVGQEGFTAYLSRDGSKGSWYAVNTSNVRTHSIHRAAELRSNIEIALSDAKRPLSEEDAAALDAFIATLPDVGVSAWRSLYNLLTNAALADSEESLKAAAWIPSVYKAVRWPDEFGAPRAA
jgi:hypothetical protein